MGNSKFEIRNSKNLPREARTVPIAEQFRRHRGDPRTILFEFRISNFEFLPHRAESLRKGPFKPLDVALALFLAGCVPTVLMAVISYSILRGTIESSIIRDRHTLVLSLARLVNSENHPAGECSSITGRVRLPSSW